MSFRVFVALCTYVGFVSRCLCILPNDLMTTTDVICIHVGVVPARALLQRGRFHQARALIRLVGWIKGQSIKSGTKPVAQVVGLPWHHCRDGRNYSGFADLNYFFFNTINCLLTTTCFHILLCNPYITEGIWDDG